MADVIPAIESKMGNITYYECTMLAQKLVSAVRPANEHDEWATLGIEERMQRELDESRIKKEIIPYLVKSPDRFFGSVIILAKNPNAFEFESIEKIFGRSLEDIPTPYKLASRNMGFLTIDGGEFIILDGQHRIVALRDIINTKSKPEGGFVSAIPNDQLCVLFIKYEDNQKTRRIFNKVNRYAKPTSRADNIITSEDDGYAVTARRLMRKGAPLGHEYMDKGKPELVVDWRNNTITGRSQKFSTLSVLYETTKDILAHHEIQDLDEKSRVCRPSDEELDTAYKIVSEWWQLLLDRIEPYQKVIIEVMNGKPPSCAEYRGDDQPFSLLFKPAGQISLIKGLIRAVERKIDREVAVERINKVDWRTSSPIWTGSIVTASGRMSTSKSSYDLAAELIAYLVGAERMKPKQIQTLTERYNKARGFNPKQQKPGTDSEKLPAPVTSQK